MESEKPKNTGRFGKGNPGKPKGALSHLTRTVKEAVLDAFNELQHDEQNNLVAFAKKNPRDFYAIAAKLIPTDIKAEVKSKILVEVVRNTKGTVAVESVASESAEGD
jgi:hypothetical protein